MADAQKHPEDETVIMETLALTEREVKKWAREPVLIVLMMIQPVVWLGLFGKAFNVTGIVTIPEEALNSLPPNITRQFSDIFNQTLTRTFGGTLDYFTYMAAGMLTVVVLFTAMFSGMSVAWDRRLGFLNKLLVAPIPRGSIVFAKVGSSVIRATLQTTLIFFVALAFGLRLGASFNPLDFAAILSCLFLLSVGLSSMFIAATIRVKKWETQAAVANLLNLPLMFASNALYPTKQMPNWLQTIANINPISYATDFIRILILHGSSLNFSRLLFDFQVIMLFAIIFATVGYVMSERALQSI